MLSFVYTIYGAVENVSSNGEFLFSNDQTNSFLIRTEEEGLSLDEFEVTFSEELKERVSSNNSRKSIGMMMSMKKLPYGELNSDFVVLPIIEIKTDMFYVAPNKVETISGYEFGYNAYQNSNTMLSAFAEYHMNGYDSSDFRGSKSEFSSLSDKKEEFFLGVKAEYVPEASPETKVTLDLSRSMGDSEGIRFRLYGQRFIQYTPDLFIVPGASYVFYDRSYVGYYYGITDAEAEDISGVSAYSPVSGHKFGINLDIIYQISPNVSFRSINSMEFLSNDIVSSPIVTDTMIISIGVGMMFMF
jgi:outer membrane protein